MEIDYKDFIYLATNLIAVTTFIVTNRQNITYLKQQNDELKEWLKQLQDKVNDIRAKVGV